MSDKIYIIGHKNPDTDAISAALAYADVKRQLGIDAEACRLGTLNEETKFATRKFNIDAPMLITDARSQLCDITFDEPEIIALTSSCNAAYKRIIKTNNQTLFVTDDDRKLLGIVSIRDLSSLRMNSVAERTELMKNTNLTLLAEDLDGAIIVDKKDFSCNGVVNVIAFGSHENIHKDVEDSICIVLDDENMQEDLIKSGASCLILGLDTKPSDKIVNLAKEKGVAIVSSSLNPTEIILLIYEAIPVSTIMTEHAVSYLNTDYVEDVAAKIATTRFRSYPVLDEEGKLLGCISRYHLFKYKRKSFILVDHSARVQSIDNLDKAEIVEIIDHHNIGDVQTTRPIYYRNQKCGCTCTIIYQIYCENGILPPPSIAGMMLSAIISDTMHFKSKTTTPVDIEVAHKLAEIAGVDCDKYAEEFLAASVNLRDGNAEDIINQDLKRYKFGKSLIAVGQTNYNNIEDIHTRLEEFEVIMKREQKSNKFDLMVMMFTHVLGDGTMFVFYGPLSPMMFEIIQTKFDDNSGYDHHIMSRKQQLIPAISELILERQ